MEAWFEAHEELFAVFFMPSYSLELNPDRFMNGNLKGKSPGADPGRGMFLNLEHDPDPLNNPKGGE